MKQIDIFIISGGRVISGGIDTEWTGIYTPSEYKKKARQILNHPRGKEKV